MNSKKQYYSLDDIGFVGTQEKRTPAQIKADAIKTANIIEALKKKQQPSKLANRRSRIVKAK